MTVIWVLIGIGTVFVFGFASIRLNVYSGDTYGYEPINMNTILLGLIPYVFLIAGQSGEHHGEHGSLAFGIIVALIVVGILIWWIAQRTSIEVAMAAGIMVVLISLVLLFIIFGLGSQSRCQHCNNYDCDCYD